MQNSSRGINAIPVNKGVFFLSAKPTGKFILEYISGVYLNATLKKLLKKHDLPDLHVHDLRHANASLLINAGVPVKFISEHLGHSNTKTTEDIYAHVYNATAEKVASAISQALDDVM